MRFYSPHYFREKKILENLAHTKSVCGGGGSYSLAHKGVLPGLLRLVINMPQNFPAFRHPFPPHLGGGGKKLKFQKAKGFIKRTKCCPSLPSHPNGIENEFRLKVSKRVAVKRRLLVKFKSFLFARVVSENNDSRLILF